MGLMKSVLIFNKRYQSWEKLFFVTPYLLGIKIWQKKHTRKVGQNCVFDNNCVNHQYHQNAFFIYLSTGVLHYLHDIYMTYTVIT